MTLTSWLRSAARASAPFLLGLGLGLAYLYGFNVIRSRLARAWSSLANAAATVLGRPHGEAARSRKDLRLEAARAEFERIVRLKIAEDRLRVDVASKVLEATGVRD